MFVAISARFRPCWGLSWLCNEASHEQDSGGDDTLEMKNQIRLAIAPLDGRAVGGRL